MAKESRLLLLQVGKRVLGSASEYTTTIMVFSGWLARAGGFDEGASAAVDADNPYAAFPLLRAYGENAAAILYVKDHLAKLDEFWRDRDGPGVKVGVMTNYAGKRFGGFRGMYRQISGFAHPHPRSVVSSHTAGEERLIRWRSAPAFRREAVRTATRATIPL